MIETAVEINSARARFTLERLTDALNEHCKPLKGSKIFLLGLVDAGTGLIMDPELLKLVTELLKRGSELTYHGEAGVEFRLPSNQTLTGRTLTDETLAAHDALIVGPGEPNVDLEWVVKHSQLVIDVANVTLNLSRNRDRIVRI